MKESFRVYLKPASVNSFYTGDRRFKSASAREWTLEALNQLNQQSILSKLERLRLEFDPHIHTYEISLTFAYPSNIIKTRKGEISSKTIDLTNCEKSIVDILFLPKNFIDLPNLNIDDKYLTKLISRKIESEVDEYYIDIEITINKLNWITKLLS